jgi:HEPN domain-containing protein
MSTQASKVWLRRAESNLHLARQGKGENVFLEDLCFEAQQAAEKSLKALLISLSGDYPKVHALGLLLERIEQFVPVPDHIKEAVELTDYAVQSRYPGDYSPVSEEEYQRAIELATKTLEWVKRQIDR